MWVVLGSKQPKEQQDIALLTNLNTLFRWSDCVYYISDVGGASPVDNCQEEK